MFVCLFEINGKHCIVVIDSAEENTDKKLFTTLPQLSTAVIFCNFSTKIKCQFRMCCFMKCLANISLLQNIHLIIRN